MASKSFRKAIESKVALERCNTIVGGVLRVGSSVEVILTSGASADEVGVRVGNGVSVMVEIDTTVKVGRVIGALVSVSVEGIGAVCAAGAQAEIIKSEIKIAIVNRFMNMSPIQDWIGIKTVTPPELFQTTEKIDMYRNGHTSTA